MKLHKEPKSFQERMDKFYTKMVFCIKIQTKNDELPIIQYYSNNIREITCFKTGCCQIFVWHAIAGTLILEQHAQSSYFLTYLIIHWLCSPHSHFNHLWSIVFKLWTEYCSFHWEFFVDWLLGLQIS